MTTRSFISNIFLIFSPPEIPAAATHILADIRAAADRLCDFPHIGRKGEFPGTHEWVVRGSPYLIVYAVDAAAAEIHVIGVFHGAQDRQEQLK